jgi:hypothetical protein
MAAQGVNLGEQRNVGAEALRLERRAHAGEAGAHYENVVLQS